MCAQAVTTPADSRGHSAPPGALVIPLGIEKPSPSLTSTSPRHHLPFLNCLCWNAPTWIFFSFKYGVCIVYNNYYLMCFQIRSDVLSLRNPCAVPMRSSVFGQTAPLQVHILRISIYHFSRVNMFLIVSIFLYTPNL